MLRNQRNQDGCDVCQCSRLITDNFKINSGGRTPGTRRANSLAVDFGSKATPHRLRFEGGAPLRSIENRINGQQDACRHVADSRRDGRNRLAGLCLGEDKENSYGLSEAPPPLSSGRLEFMDSVDLTLLESPITTRQFSEISAKLNTMGQSESAGRTPSKFAVARRHLIKTPEHGWPKGDIGIKSPFLHMDCTEDEPGPSKVPQLSHLSEYAEAETLHDLEAALEEASEGGACSRYEIISTDSPETGRTCGLADEMDSDFVFGAPIAHTETTKNFNMLSRVPSNTTANRMLNFDSDKENSPQPKATTAPGRSAHSLSFANRIRALKDNTSNNGSVSALGLSAASWKRDSWSEAATPKISRCLNFGLELSRSEDSGYSPRNSESSRGSPIGPVGRPSAPRMLHSDSMESGCVSEISEDFNVYDQHSEGNVFKSSQETTMDILFAMDESPRVPSSIKSLMSAPILSRHSSAVLEDHMETAEDAWSPNLRPVTGVDEVDHRLSSPLLQSFPVADGDDEGSVTPGTVGGRHSRLRRSVSLNNPDVQRIRTKLFDSPGAPGSCSSAAQLLSPFKVPAASRAVNRPVKRLDPSPSDGATGESLCQQAKRARVRDPSTRPYRKGDSPKAAVRPLLQRSFSDNAANIKMALARSVAEPDLIGDFSRPFSLPLTPGKHSDLRAITAETLAMLIDGAYGDTVDQFQVVDCRYPYEFDGGHIRGALNLYRRDQVLRSLLGPEQALPPADGRSKKRILVFHCEFSKERGPNLCRYLRWQDRSMHKEVYPRLMHPEIYLLHGGYRTFHRLYGHLCSGGYTRMLSPTHANKLRTFRTSAQSNSRKLI